jgi:ABC-type phosphate transport system substrate-binding protein
MKPKSIATLLVVGLSALAHAQSVSAQADVAAVVNARNPTVNVSLAELRRIFAGEKHSWPSGQRIKLVVRAPGSHERLVLLKLLGMSEAEYKQYWTAQVFRGEADTEPFTVPSVGMQREAVSTFPEAITLVDATDVKPGMKVMKVDGHMPGESGYPVH